MCGSVLSMNVSAQSPPCSRNASPRATEASRSRSRSTSGGSVTGGTLSSTVRTCGDVLGVGPVGLLRGRAAQRVVEAGPQVGGQRRQLGQHFDRGVDGPVHDFQD